MGNMAGREGQNGLHSRSLSGEGLPGSLLGPGGRRRTSSSQQGGASVPGQGRSRRVSYATPPFLASNAPDPGRSPFETELTAVLPQPLARPLCWDVEAMTLGWALDMLLLWIRRLCAPSWS